MLRKRIWIIIASFLVVLCVVAAAIHWGAPAYYQNKLRKEFVPDPNYPQYQEGTPVHEIDFDVILRRMSVGIAPIGLTADTSVVLPRDIRYYTWEDGEKKLALTLEKGTRVQWAFDTNLGIDGYGHKSYPTYEKGWRYVRAFQPYGYTKEYVDVSPYYYVRLDDIEAVTRSIYDQTTIWKTSPISKGTTVYFITRYIDRLFYERGVYCSPDLTRPLAL